MKHPAYQRDHDHPIVSFHSSHEFDSSEHPHGHEAGCQYREHDADRQPLCTTRGHINATILPEDFIANLQQIHFETDVGKDALEERKVWLFPEGKIAQSGESLNDQINNERS
jgi:hypothetical protein